MISTWKLLWIACLSLVNASICFNIAEYLAHNDHSQFELAWCLCEKNNVTLNLPLNWDRMRSRREMEVGDECMWWGVTHYWHHIVCWGSQAEMLHDSTALWIGTKCMHVISERTYSCELHFRMSFLQFLKKRSVMFACHNGRGIEDGCYGGF